VADFFLEKFYNPDDFGIEIRRLFLLEETGGNRLSVFSGLSDFRGEHG
jgi:hypothetical protein